MNHSRYVKVVAVSQAGLDRQGDRNRLIQETLERAVKAIAVETPRVVCLPECFAGREPEPIPGPSTERLAALAREHGCWFICPLTASVDGTLRNTAIVIDDGGQRIGRYDKTYLTENELTRGLVPGPLDPPVFETGFGRIGIRICFDINWRDAWECLKAKGAQIIFWPSAYPAPRQLSALAWMHEVFVVSATRGVSAIFDISGDGLDRSGKLRQWAAAVLCLDKRLFEIDHHGQIHDLAAAYGDRVRVCYQHDEDWFTLETLDPELDMNHLIAEYGLTPKKAYHARCEAANAEARRQETCLAKDG